VEAVYLEEGIRSGIGKSDGDITSEGYISRSIGCQRPD
jgi:hypothetical protein